MRQLKPVDVVIAGGGFVGLTLAKAITARTSLSVVVLERGLPRKLSDYAAGMNLAINYSGRAEIGSWRFARDLHNRNAMSWTMRSATA